MKLRWTDSEDIALALIELRPEVDPLQVRFLQEENPTLDVRAQYNVRQYRDRDLGIINVATDEWQFLTASDLQFLTAVSAQLARQAGDLLLQLAFLVAQRLQLRDRGAIVDRRVRS